MRFLFLFAAVGVLSAQSNPSWWKYLPPESASIVGIQWKQVQATVFAPAIAADLAPGGTLGFPDVELLRNAEQILIGSPTILAVEYGTFPIEKLRAQAESKGLKKVAFRPAELYVSTDPAVLSIAYVSEKLVLVGSRRTLEDTINRIANPKDRAFSPLLARAARYSKEDLWVVASRLPDPLASRYLPVEIDATAFEGSVSAWDGLHMVASVERPTPNKALDFADSLAEVLAARPAMAVGTEITTRDRSVLIRMDLDEEQLASSLKLPSGAPAAVVALTPPKRPQAKAFVPPPVQPVPAAVEPASLVAAAASETSIAVPTLMVAPKAMLPPGPPKTVKILGLDSGPKEIPLGH